MDSQIVELLGRNRLVDELLRAGLEVASPVRDRGIDLIAYLDLSPELSAFRSFPIQMKACSTEAFSIDAKYAKFPDLVLAYIWNIEHPEKQATFAMSYAEALGIADAMGWTRTTSWANGSYANTSPGAKLKALLQRYRSTPARWHELVIGKPSAAADPVPPPSLPLPVKISGPTAIPDVSFGEPRPQREVMRDIHARFRADHQRIIEEYAAAERRGEVRRNSNAADRDRESYARALLADGIKKGWLR